MRYEDIQHHALFSMTTIMGGRSQNEEGFSFTTPSEYFVTLCLIYVELHY